MATETYMRSKLVFILFKFWDHSLEINDYILHCPSLIHFAFVWYAAILLINWDLGGTYTTTIHKQHLLRWKIVRFGNYSRANADGHVSIHHDYWWITNNSRSRRRHRSWRTQIDRASTGRVAAAFVQQLVFGWRIIHLLLHRRCSCIAETGSHRLCGNWWSSVHAFRLVDHFLLSLLGWISTIRLRWWSTFGLVGVHIYSHWWSRHGWQFRFADTRRTWFEVIISRGRRL